LREADDVEDGPSRIDPYLTVLFRDRHHLAIDRVGADGSPDVGEVLLTAGLVLSCFSSVSA
jgi:hypothetical protein